MNFEEIIEQMDFEKPNVDIYDKYVFLLNGVCNILYKNFTLSQYSDMTNEQKVNGFYFIVAEKLKQVDIEKPSDYQVVYDGILDYYRLKIIDSCNSEKE